MEARRNLRPNQLTLHLPMRPHLAKPKPALPCPPPPPPPPSDLEAAETLLMLLLDPNPVDFSPKTNNRTTKLEEEEEEEKLSAPGRGNDDNGDDGDGDDSNGEGVNGDGNRGKDDENGKYRCKMCGMGFRSHQSLGGHTSNHFKIPKSEDDKDYEKGVTRKMFKCRMCNQVFGSGQALGGHKRAHFASHPLGPPSYIFNEWLMQSRRRSSSTRTQ